MRQLHRALEVADLAGQHHPGALDQRLLEVLGVEERRRHLRAADRPSVTTRYSRLGCRLVHRDLGFGDDVDERDVFTLLGRLPRPRRARSSPSLYLRG